MIGPANMPGKTMWSALKLIAYIEGLSNKSGGRVESVFILTLTELENSQFKLNLLINLG